MNKPILCVVDDEADALERTAQALRLRYGADYEIQAHTSPTEALNCLEDIRNSEQEVALFLADLWMPEMSGGQFLIWARRICHNARQALLVDLADQSASESIWQAMIMGQIEVYVGKPLTQPDEQFYRNVTELLTKWSRQEMRRGEMVRLVAARWSARSHELRDLLERNGIPTGFYESDTPEGETLLAQVGLGQEACPVVILSNGVALENPTNWEIADALQVHTLPSEAARHGEMVFDVAIVGAGPAGLSAAVYGASEGLSTMVIEREAIGGQAGTSSLIRNYLGFPTGISGNDLAGRAYRQAWLFGAHFYFTREATGLATRDGHHLLTLSDGSEIASRAVVLAVGVSYRRLGVPNLEALVGRGVFYGAAVSEGLAMQGQHVYVIGGANSAGQAALHLARFAEQVTMVVRASSLTQGMSEYLILEIAERENIDVLFNTEVIDASGEFLLEELVLRDNPTGRTWSAPAGGLFVLIGARPHTGWLPASIKRDGWGYVLTGRDMLEDERLPSQWPLEREPWRLETSLPGVFAVGDVRCGSVKRVASAVGAGSISIQQVHQYLNELERQGVRRDT